MMMRMGEIGWSVGLNFAYCITINFAECNLQTIVIELNNYNAFATHFIDFEKGVSCRFR